jgi:regulator of protease activity HflC (stomatin/prohibitin superfamily)
VALNEVFATYDPLAPQNLDTSPLPGLSAKATKIMADKVGSQVTIFEVQVPTIAYDKNTEEKINNINAQRADTAKALEAQKTAAAQAEANRILSQSVNNDPNVLVSKCLDVARDKGLALMCWPMAVSPVLPVTK